MLKCLNFIQSYGNVLHTSPFHAIESKRRSPRSTPTYPARHIQGVLTGTGGYVQALPGVCGVGSVSSSSRPIGIVVRSGISSKNLRANRVITELRPCGSVISSSTGEWNLILRPVSVTNVNSRPLYCLTSQNCPHRDP